MYLADPAVLDAVARASAAQASPEAIELVAYDPSQARQARHQALFFLKPELTAAGELEHALSTVDDVLGGHGVRTGALRVVNGPLLRERGIVERHYGVINRVAREGRGALTDDARARLESEFRSQLDSGAEVLGGFELLERSGELNAEELARRVDAAGSAKLASGTYCCALSLDGADVLVLNGFHPQQVEYLTGSGKTLVVFEALTDVPWQPLRSEVLGATDPAAAQAGSLRAVLRDQAERLGLGVVDPGHNCVHGSAGPLEAVAELVRFLDLVPRDTSFGRELLERGAAEDALEGWLGNAPVDGTPAFDLTEERDAGDAADALLAHSPVQ